MRVGAFFVLIGLKKFKKHRIRNESKTNKLYLQCIKQTNRIITPKTNNMEDRVWRRIERLIVRFITEYSLATVVALSTVVMLGVAVIFAVTLK